MNTTTTTNNKRLVIILGAALSLLLVPLIGMQFSTDINWKVFDFIVMGILLLGAGISVEFVLRRVSNRQSRLVLLALIVLGFLLIWAELAVGIFGTPFAGN